MAVIYPPPSSLEYVIEEGGVKHLSAPGELYNDSVQAYRWENLDAILPAQGKKPLKHLLHSMSGEARAGELVAIMGPSGSGKTMLLNRLALRGMPVQAKLSGFAYVNESPVDTDTIRSLSSYVEQKDHLIGSITAAETLYFAGRLSSYLSPNALKIRIEGLLASFGLAEHADTIIGTPIREGLSGGQQRRVSVASQLITSPKILFLDEPTSGLDSVASYEVMSYLKKVAKRNNLIIIASIHQPSTSTFNRFDKVYLLAKGHLCYGGPRTEVAAYFKTLGFVLPPATNPAEWILELVDTDFAHNKETSMLQLDRIIAGWESNGIKPTSRSFFNSAQSLRTRAARRHSAYTAPIPLLHRNYLKSYRDVLPYWVRVAMYTCLALLMGTCWLRLGTSQNDILPRITAIFFGGAFLSFMSVAYIPAYIEDQATFFKERANGLYGPTSFLVANFVIGIPYIALIAVLFSVIAYWLVNLWPTAQGFWIFVAFLFLDLLAAESLVVLVSSIVPNFVLSLALVAFANGLWMCVNGFLVPETVLNVFWKSWVTKIDYQNWVFRAMMWNEFHLQEFKCAQPGECAFPPSQDGMTIPGTSVLRFYGYSSGTLGAYAAYILAITAAYRALAWLVLSLRK